MLYHNSRFLAATCNPLLILKNAIILTIISVEKLISQWEAYIPPHPKDNTPHPKNHPSPNLIPSLKLATIKLLTKISATFVPTLYRLHPPIG
jgi:hypothetical protein